MAKQYVQPITLIMTRAEAGKVPVYAYDTSSSNDPKTGDAGNITAQISKDGAASAATNDTNPTELDSTNHPGVYLFDTTATEMTADLAVIDASSSTANIELVPVWITTKARTGFKKNTAYSNFTVTMFDTADGRTPKTGESVSGYVSLDGGAYAALTNSVSEIGSSGTYKVNLAAADLNGDHVAMYFTSTNTIKQHFYFKTET